nr:unnamed protein product [Spirometra erinaceieuropaei]
MPPPSAGDSPPPVRLTRSGRQSTGPTAFGGKDDVGGSTVRVDPTLASMEKSSFEIATETVEEGESENLSGDVERRDSCVLISDLSVLFPLVQMNDCRVIEIYAKNETRAEHVLIVTIIAFRFRFL